MLYLCHLILYLVVGAVEGRVPGDHGVAEGVPVLLGAVHPQAAGDVLGVDGAVPGQRGVDAAEAGVVRGAGANQRSVSSGVTTNQRPVILHGVTGAADTAESGHGGEAGGEQQEADLQHVQHLWMICKIADNRFMGHLEPR